MIEIKQMSFQYKNSNQATLKDINMTIREGEFVTIIGKNGSGKSTLARLIAGIHKPKEGTILVDGVSVSDKKQFLTIRKKMGIVFQNPDHQVIFPTVQEDMKFALKNLKLDHQQERISSALEKVDMKGYEAKDTAFLSLGQKQRIAIAGILAIDTPYLVLDEPTTMLDSKGKQKIYQIVLELKQQGYTIIYVTNVMDEILLSDRSILMEEGSIKLSFSRKELLQQIPILEQHDIQIPGIVRAIEQLQKQGIDLHLKEWSMEEMVNEIVRLQK